MVLSRGSCELAGISEQAVHELVTKLEEYNCHSFMIIRDGIIAAEGWWDPYKPENTHSMFSVTKSFTSVAIGFAVDEGLLSVDDKVLSFFPGLLPSPPCENMQKMQVKHLLTMSTGHTSDLDFGWSFSVYNVEDRGHENDHVYTFLTSYVPLTPGTEWHYNTAATFMLGAVLHRLTGKNVLDYLRPRLLDPLEITEIFSEENTKGTTPAGFGFQVTTYDLAKFGYFLLNRGKWNGKQLLSERWIDEASSKQIDTLPTNENDHHQSKAGYCYQFWLCSDGKSFRADGLFGQLAIMSPDLNTVVALTCGSEDKPKILDAVFEALNTGFSNNDKSNSYSLSLMERLQNLTMPHPQGEAIGSFNLKVPRPKYELSENMLNITAVRFDVEASTFEIWKQERHCTIGIGKGKWLVSKTGEDPYGMADFFGDVACAGAWVEDKLVLKIIHTLTPYTDTFEFNLKEESLIGEFRRFPCNFRPDCKLLGLRV
jgi:CubicO group peptidase (beta-lactamase class C family)